jgi:hypothetical protein
MFSTNWVQFVSKLDKAFFKIFIKTVVYRQKSWEKEMRKKLMIESMAITTMLAVISMSALCTSAFAWTGYVSNPGGDSDGSTWQVSARITGYYWTAGQYEEVLFQSWRGCISPVSYNSGMRLRWYMDNGTHSLDSGFVWVGDETGPIYKFQYYQPSTYGMDYVITGFSYSGSYFIISGQNQYKYCYANL